MSYSVKSYRLTKDEYNYILPVLREKLLYKGEIEGYYFCGDTDELYDMLSRLKGLYGYFDSYNGIIDYNCAKHSSLEPFRNEMKGVSSSFSIGDKVIWDSHFGYDIALFLREGVAYDHWKIELHSGKFRWTETIVSKSELHHYSKELIAKLTKKYGYEKDFS